MSQRTEQLSLSLRCN